MIGQHPVFGPALLAQRIAGLGSRSGMAHQQIAGFSARQPAIEKLCIPVLAAGQSVYAEEAGVGGVSGSRRQRFETPGSQKADEVRFQLARPVDRTERLGRQSRPDPWMIARVASLKKREQALADKRKLVYVLMPVDVIGWRAADSLEGIELPFDFVGNERDRQSARPGVIHQPVQRLTKRVPRQGFGQVKMQAPLKWKVRQLVCLLPERVCPRHATDRGKPPRLGQANDSAIDLAR